MREDITYDQDEAFALLKLMVNTNTVNPPGNELALAEAIKPVLEKEGLLVSIDEFIPGRYNMIVRYPGKISGSELMATGHLDTVPLGDRKWIHDPFGCEVEDGKAYGRGISDMKSGDAAALYSLILLKRSGFVPENDIVFVATAGEEKFSIGAHDFVQKGGMDKAKALLVCEPSGLELGVAHKGAYFVKTEFYGKTAHGSMPYLGINAIAHLADFVKEIGTHTFGCEPDPHLGLPTVSLNLAKGGAAMNVVPDEAECILDFRTIPGQTWVDVKAFLDEVLTTLSKKTEDLKFAYMKMAEFPSVACPENHKILDAFDDAAGYKMKRKYINFYTDASAMVPNSDFPVVIVGPGETSQAHQPDEYMLVDKFYEAISIYYNFFKHYKV